MNGIPNFLQALVENETFFSVGCPTCKKDVIVNHFMIRPQTGPACQSCAHVEGSSCLQIRRSSYCEVVRVDDIDRLVDCSKIQRYTINQQRVLFIRHRPQSRPPKGAHGESSCAVCDRQLLEASMRYCSLQCFYLHRNPGARSGLGLLAAAAGSPPPTGPLPIAQGTKATITAKAGHVGLLSSVAGMAGPGAYYAGTGTGTGPYHPAAAPGGAPRPQSDPAAPKSPTTPLSLQAVGQGHLAALRGFGPGSSQAQAQLQLQLRPNHQAQDSGVMTHPDKSSGARGSSGPGGFSGFLPWTGAAQSQGQAQGQGYSPGSDSSPGSPNQAQNPFCFSAPSRTAQLQYPNTQTGGGRTRGSGSGDSNSRPWPPFELEAQGGKGPGPGPGSGSGPVPLLQPLAPLSLPAATHGHDQQGSFGLPQRDCQGSGSSSGAAAVTAADGALQGQGQGLWGWSQGEGLQTPGQGTGGSGGWVGQAQAQAQTYGQGPSFEACAAALGLHGFGQYPFALAQAAALQNLQNFHLLQWHLQGVQGQGLEGNPGWVQDGFVMGYAGAGEGGIHGHRQKGRPYRAPMV